MTEHLFGEDFVAPVTDDPLDFSDLADLLVDGLEGVGSDIFEFDDAMVGRVVRDSATGGLGGGERVDLAIVAVALPSESPPIVMPPLFDASELEERGDEWYRVADNVLVGKVTYMVQWDPPSMSMKYRHKDHTKCYLTADVSDEGRDALKLWLQMANSCENAYDHKACRPSGLRS